MEDLPPLVHESTPTLDCDPDCPFCAIIENYPPISPSLLTNPKSAIHLDPHKLDPPAFVVLSTPHVIAFLDVYPLTRGHVLVCPRRHGVKLGDLTSTEGAEVSSSTFKKPPLVASFGLHEDMELSKGRDISWKDHKLTTSLSPPPQIGRLLPLLSRALTHSTMPNLPHTHIDYNIVQNNGPGAAQVVPHTHFHFVPRYPFEYVPPRIERVGGAAGGGQGGMEARYVSEEEVGADGREGGGKEARDGREVRNEMPKGMKATAILFGRGQRHYRDDDEAEDLVRVIRGCVKEEWEREFGREGDGVGVGEVGGEGRGRGEIVRRNGLGERGGKL